MRIKNKLLTSKIKDFWGPKKHKLFAETSLIKTAKAKKAVSPVVSTVLLMIMVIILALIIFLWAKSFIGEKIEKFDKPIENVCVDVNFRASIEGRTKLLLVNQGNVPIHAVNIKEISPGTSEIKEKIIDLDKGSSKNESISLSSSTESVVIIPVLLGRSGGKFQTKSCPENLGIEIEL